MLVEVRVIDVNHARLGKRGEHLVRALRGIVCARLKRGRAESGMKAREAVPGFVNHYLDAAAVRRFDDGLQVVAQSVVSAARQHQCFGVGMLLDGF